MQPEDLDAEPSPEPKTVLLWVESEPLSELLSIFLLSSGYVLLSVINEEDARKQWMFNSDRVDLLVCDWTAPHVFSSTRYFLQCRPDLSVLALLPEAFMLDNLPAGGVSLQKPFDQNQFLDFVGDLLGSVRLHEAAV